MADPKDPYNAPTDVILHPGERDLTVGLIEQTPGGSPGRPFSTGIPKPNPHPFG